MPRSRALRTGRKPSPWGSESADLKSWGDARLNEFRGMLGFAFPGYLVTLSGSGGADAGLIAAQIALLTAQAAAATGQRARAAAAAVQHAGGQGRGSCAEDGPADHGQPGVWDVGRGERGDKGRVESVERSKENHEGHKGHKGRHKGFFLREEWGRVQFLEALTCHQREG